MLQAHPGVPPQHARARVAHHLPDLLALGARVTMHGALGASGLVVAKMAASEPGVGVSSKLLADGAEDAALAMLAVAINTDHGGHRFPFPGPPPNLAR